MTDDKHLDTVWGILICPNCGASLIKSEQEALCSGCLTHYHFNPSGALDLRLQNPKTYPHEFILGNPLIHKPESELTPLPLNPKPEVDYSSFDVPFHLSREILSYFPKAKADDALMLDLGCGDTIHRDVCEHAGFKYVGLDYSNEDSPILGDAHSLPFQDESFEFVLSIAVLEHIRFPFIMMKEAFRVLKPNGLFIGTVSFLEPFHMDSFYHHTHLGTFNSLQEGGFTVEHLSPNHRWSGLVALSNMALFPGMSSSRQNLIVAPLELLHKSWWRLKRGASNKTVENTRLTTTTGSFVFIARK